MRIQTARRTALAPAASACSRPLRAGRSFLLVVPQEPRIVQRAWDKAGYEPGGACELILRGRRLGAAPIPLAIEVQEGEGPWVAAGTVDAHAGTDGAEARAQWRFPGLQQAPAGALLEARWGSPEAGEGGELRLEARAHGLDGEHVIWRVEREGSDGEWREVAAWDGVVAGGLAEARWAPPPEASAKPAAGGALLEARFEQLSPERLVLGVRADGFDGCALQLLLEQEVDGAWVQCASASATVRAGGARAELATPGSGPSGAAGIDGIDWRRGGAR